MIKIYSKVNPNKILHIVYRRKNIINDRENIVEPENYIQLSSLRMNAGKTFRPHKHFYKDGEDSVIAQESWVVIKGKVKCIFYDLDDSLIGTWVLESGDCSITLEGGHNYEILEDDTIVYEYKTGPYKGVENDKVFIGEKDL
jgi:cupin fold WbuC family metalloprotein